MRIQQQPVSVSAIGFSANADSVRPGEFYEAETWTAEMPTAQRSRRKFLQGLITGLKRRWARERRRRKVGRAYDMALEIARIVPCGSEVLDVGCGNGFIAHHLSAMLGTRVIGIDVQNDVKARIDYRFYDGVSFPLPNNSVDVVLLCYVLHHAQDVRAVLTEARRILRNDGLVVIYEDIPQAWPDRVVCWFHNRKWKAQTGPCRFRNETEWAALFKCFGFESACERQLSRWRNLMHPVSRRLFVLQSTTQASALNRRISPGWRSILLTSPR